MLNAEQELLDAQAALIDAEIQQFVAVYSLLAAMGLLTVEHLKRAESSRAPAHQRGRCVARGRYRSYDR